MRAAAMGRLSLVILTSRKPVAALRGAKYVIERGIDLDKLKEETVFSKARRKRLAALSPRPRMWPRRCGWPRQIGGDSRSRHRRAGRNRERARNSGVGDFGRFRIV